jgi:hypothetical protein
LDYASLHPLAEDVKRIPAKYVSGNLSFAKNASADMTLCGNTFITVMQTAELLDLDDPATTQDLPRNRTLLVEAQMGPRSGVPGRIPFGQNTRRIGKAGYDGLSLCATTSWFGC